MAPQVYRVKRYPNRRMYSEELSRYVTVQDVAQAVKDGLQVVATVHKDGKDITKKLLLDVLVHEQQQRATLSKEFLHNLILKGESILTQPNPGATT